MNATNKKSEQEVKDIFNDACSYPAAVIVQISDHAMLSPSVLTERDLYTLSRLTLAETKKLRSPNLKA